MYDNLLVSNRKLMQSRTGLAPTLVMFQAMLSIFITVLASL